MKTIDTKALQAQMDNIAATLLIEVSKANPQATVKEREQATLNIFRQLYENAGGLPCS